MLITHTLHKEGTKKFHVKPTAVISEANDNLVTLILELHNFLFKPAQVGTCKSCTSSWVVYLCWQGQGCSNFDVNRALN